MRRLIQPVMLVVLVAHLPATLGAVAQSEGGDPCDTIFDQDFAQVLLDTNTTGDFIDDYDPDRNGIACDHDGPPDTDGQAVLTTEDGDSMTVVAGNESQAVQQVTPENLTCAQISTQELAQWMFDRNPSRYPLLDEDGDGIACEGLPSGGPVGGATSGQAVPTATVTPPPVTPTPSTGLTDQEEAYLDAIRADGNELASILEQIGPLFQQAGNNPAVIFNEAWQLELAALLVQWETVSERAQTYQPSARQQHIHTIWLAISDLNLRAIDDIIQGVDAIDADALARGTARMTYMTLLIQDVTAAVTQFMADPNAPFTPTHATYPVPGCDVFPSYEEAQQYYAAYPEEQPTIDPNIDGRACEVHFGR